MFNEATRQNIVRKSEFVDRVQVNRDGLILPSWIDLNVTELCNRGQGAIKPCVFCPRIDPSVYPNQKLHMTVGLAEVISRQLHELNFQGAITLCGFGEPLFHVGLESIARAFGNIRVELVTNGDFLDVERIKQLDKNGVDFFVVSMYDGPHQVEIFQEKFARASNKNYLLRDRWHKEDKNFGLKLTNRAGMVQAGNQEPVDKKQPCWYLTYQMMIDWNGDVLLCPQDWSKKTRFGNLNSERLIDIWATAMHKRRMKLITGNRNVSPCKTCNTQGTLHGACHVVEWSIQRDPGSHRARPQPGGEEMGRPD